MCWFSRPSIMTTVQAVTRPRHVAATSRSGRGSSGYRWGVKLLPPLPPADACTWFTSRMPVSRSTTTAA